MIRLGVFDRLKDGRIIYSYTIYNTRGEYVQLLNYGASIHKICVLDRNGKLGDVVMGTADGRALEENMTCEGSTIGRVANRIKHGRCTVDGKELHLDCNMAGHFLHGAGGNYAHRLFEASADEENNTVTFHVYDEGEGGFGCGVDARLSFCFDDDARLSLSYEFFPEDTTVISPTNHVYFNLSGKDARDQILVINTDQKASRDEEGLPCGGTESVAETPADFTVPRTIRAGMEQEEKESGPYFGHLPKRYDEFYVLPKGHEGPAAVLYDPESGRELKVYTDMESLIIFNNIEEKPAAGKDGILYEGYCGLSLETQFVPNAVNCPGFCSPVFRKEDVFRSTTIYAFSVRKQ